MSQSVAWSMPCGVSVADLFVHIRGITDRSRVFKRIFALGSSSKLLIDEARAIYVMKIKKEPHNGVALDLVVTGGYQGRPAGQVATLTAAVLPP
ncbi:hypothetical protein COOFOMLJ_02244 [Aeromonas veronii]